MAKENAVVFNRVERYSKVVFPFGLNPSTNISWRHAHKA